MTEAAAVKSAPLFTQESANRALPYVRAVAEDLADAYRRLGRAEEARTRALAAGEGSPTGRTAVLDAEDARRSARADFARCAKELAAAGVEIKDPEIGLLDFPGELPLPTGEPGVTRMTRVLLCWRIGEERVAFWHDLKSGFQGRRPLPGAEPAGEAPPPAKAGPTPRSRAARDAALDDSGLDREPKP